MKWFNPLFVLETDHTSLVSNQALHISEGVWNVCTSAGVTKFALSGSPEDFHSGPADAVVTAKLLRRPVMLLCGCFPQEPCVGVYVDMSAGNLTGEELKRCVCLWGGGWGGYCSRIREGLYCPC